MLSSAHTLMCEMDRNEKRAVIKYLTFKGLSAVEISTELNSVLGDNAPSDATIYRWIAEFQRGRKSTEDEHRSGRPVDMCTDENVQRVNDMITTDRRLTVSYVAKCLIWHNTSCYYRRAGLQQGVCSMGTANADA